MRDFEKKNIHVWLWLQKHGCKMFINSNLAGKQIFMAGHHSTLAGHDLNGVIKGACVEDGNSCQNGTFKTATMTSNRALEVVLGLLKRHGEILTLLTTVVQNIFSNLFVYTRFLVRALA